jgi:hypothetical protein
VARSGTFLAISLHSLGASRKRAALRSSRAARQLQSLSISKTDGFPIGPLFAGQDSSKLKGGFTSDAIQKSRDTLVSFRRLQL